MMYIVVVVVGSVVKGLRLTKVCIPYSFFIETFSACDLMHDLLTLAIFFYVQRI